MRKSACRLRVKNEVVIKGRDAYGVLRTVVRCRRWRVGRSARTKCYMERRKRNHREEIRVNWDDVTHGEWHYVPKSSLTVLPNSEMIAGGRVSLKWKGEVWTGTIGAKRKKSKISSGQLKRGESRSEA